jgi:hypothetical protein
MHTWRMDSDSRCACGVPRCDHPRARAHPHTRPRAGALCVVQQRRSVSVQRPYRRYRRYCCRVRQALGTRLDVRNDQNIREEVQVM